MQFQLDKQQFEETVQTLNNLYAEAEKLGGKSYLEGCLACLTAYTIFLCMETHYEKVNTLQASHMVIQLNIALFLYSYTWKILLFFIVHFKHLHLLLFRC